jgi:adenosine kinase
VAAGYAIEVRGCQEHRYTRAEFLARYRAAFGSSDDVAAALG